MNNELIIRWAKKEDIPTLIHFCKLHAEYEQAEYSTEGKSENLIQSIFSENPALYCLIAELNNEAIGYATYMKQFSTWDANYYIYMDCLFLTEKARGFGAGEKIINRIKKETKILNCNLIQWQTPEFNVRAMKFYNRIGATSKIKARYFLEV